MDAATIKPEHVAKAPEAWNGRDFFGGFLSHGGTPIAGWFSSWKIPCRNGWFLRVALFWETIMEMDSKRFDDLGQDIYGLKYFNIAQKISKYGFGRFVFPMLLQLLLRDPSWTRVWSWTWRYHLHFHCRSSSNRQWAAFSITSCGVFVFRWLEISNEHLTLAMASVIYAKHYPNRRNPAFRSS